LHTLHLQHLTIDAPLRNTYRCSRI
jgi:hypothetical protein